MKRALHRTIPIQRMGSRLFRRSQRWCLLVIVADLFSSFAGAQTRQTSRITQPIDERVRVTLKGNVHPLALPDYDRGPVADSFPVQRMFLLLERPFESEARSEEHTSELQSRFDLVCRLLL